MDSLVILYLKVRCWRDEERLDYGARVALVDHDGRTLQDYPVMGGPDQPSAIRLALEEATRQIAAGELGLRPSAPSTGGGE